MSVQSAAITMVYNEAVFLPLWLDYYGKNLGYNNLYIIDHGSDDGSTTRIPGNIIKIPRTDFDDVQRVTFINSLQKALFSYFDCVIYTDCDEFLIPHPNHYTCLGTYLKQHPHSSVVRAVGVDVVQHDLALAPVDFTQPILPQRPYGFVTPWESKPLITRTPVTWAPGFHDCDQPSVLDEALWLFHLKFCDLRHALARLNLTRSMKWSQQGMAFGQHQRHRDEDLLALVRTLIAEQQAEGLEQLPLTELLANGGYSKLRHIPAPFLPRL
ncbi:MAG: glycosyltransferase family 2 protein [Acetobacter orientalis]|uniref:glycosyltransferase family 2 protein n=1 Tax=Acetobacter orientalis TaxID=146474 RepID=UPI0039E9885B